MPLAKTQRWRSGGIGNWMLYAVAPAIAFAMYVTVAVIWVVPDTRIERTLSR